MPKKTLSVIKETKNEAIIQLKRNQKKLFVLAESISTHNRPLTKYIQPYDKGHGRIISRQIEVFEITETSKALDKEWNNISCIIKVVRSRQVMNTKEKSYTKPEINVHYYISTKLLDAKTFAVIIQGHWGIENIVNHVKDVQFKEDLSKIRVKPGLFSRLRDLSLNIMRINNVVTISQERFINGCNINHTLNYKRFA